jgi:hypothetical protein
MDVLWGWESLADSGFESLNGVVQPFTVGRSEGLELDPDFARAAPPDDGMFDEDRSFVLGEVEEEIDFHSCDSLKVAFDPTSFSREIQRFGNEVETILVAERSGKQRRETGLLSYDHSGSSQQLAAGSRRHSHDSSCRGDAITRDDDRDVFSLCLPAPNSMSHANPSIHGH